MADQDVEGAPSQQQVAGSSLQQPQSTSNDPPPSYQTNQGTAISPPFHRDEPPSYDSLYGRVREVKRSSSGIGSFIKGLAALIVGTIGCTICIGIVLAIPISMIVIGAIYKDDCRVEPYIPIYLIVGGCFGILKNLSNVGQRSRNHYEEDEEANLKTNPFDSIISCFLLAWFIAGNVWIYRVYGIVDTESMGDPNYCHATLYYFAFWLTTSTYILVGMMCFCLCCAAVYGTVAD